MTKKKTPRKKSDLDFLFDIVPGHRGWSVEEVEKFIGLIKLHSNDKNKWEIISHKLGNRSASGCQLMCQELKRAAKQGYSLKDYLEAGRPCRYGKESLT